jgi:hypothetical protein
MATRKKVAEVVEYIQVEEAVEVAAPEPAVEVKRPITREESLIEGKDAPLTSMIYGGGQVFNPDPTPQLPEATGQIQGEMSPLQRFINLYQPGEMVMKHNFRSHLLKVLEDWKNG